MNINIGQTNWSIPDRIDVLHSFPRSLKPALVFCLVAAGFMLFPLAASATQGEQVAWAGRGSYRLLVRIDAVSIGGRVSDQMPAEIIINFRDDVASRLGVAGKLDVSSVQVMRYDPVSGQPVPFGKYAYGTTAWDCPFRWYDEAIPYNFPDYHRSVAATNGAIRDWKYVEKWGHLFGTLGEWDSGHLAWVHTQVGDKPSYYALYFDVLAPGKQPATNPPAGFLGDAMERRAPSGLSTTGLLDSRMAI